MLQVIKDTNIDDSIWKSRRAGNDFVSGRQRLCFLGIEECGKPHVEKFGEIAADVRKCRRQGEVMSVGSFNARIGKSSQPDDIIGQRKRTTTFQLS